MEPNQFVVRDLSDLAAGNMVDVAGGEGRNALWFASRGWNVENVEISRVALEKYQLRAEREMLQSRCHSNLSEAESATFTLKPDLVLFAYLQIPFPNLSSALSNAYSQMPEGAKLYGVWHALRNLTEGFGGPPNAELLPSPEQLRSWAECNLSSFEVFEQERVVEKDGQQHTAIDVILSGTR